MYRQEDKTTGKYPIIWILWWYYDRNQSQAKQNNGNDDDFDIYNKYITINCFKWVWVMLAFTTSIPFTVTIFSIIKTKRTNKRKKRTEINLYRQTTPFMCRSRNTNWRHSRKSKTHTLHAYSTDSTLNLEFAPVFPGDLMVWWYGGAVLVHKTAFCRL